MTLFKQFVKHQTIPERPCIRRGILRNQQSAKRKFSHPLLLAVSGNLSDLVPPQRGNIIGIFRGIRLHFRGTHRVRQQPLILQTRQNLPRKINTGSHHLCPVFIARVIYFIQNIIPVRPFTGNSRTVISPLLVIIQRAVLVVQRDRTCRVISIREWANPISKTEYFTITSVQIQTDSQTRDQLYHGV